MSVRRSAWLLFAAFALTLPFPAFGPFGGTVPAVHHVILLAATLAIALVEGAAGPVPEILALFAIHAAVTLALTALAAWLCARLLARSSPAVRRSAVWAVCAALVAVSLAFELYETPFGRAPTANLLGVF
jgi:hypothetical protein